MLCLYIYMNRKILKNRIHYIIYIYVYLYTYYINITFYVFFRVLTHMLKLKLFLIDGSVAGAKSRQSPSLRHTNEKKMIKQ